ncbi:eukaryotic translation initiation factor 4 gamma 1-like [Trichomycterus rosablanca]|uniref:eukaryotic translation initiation factor 4 gamma 1-like n=1 Tax=Trichomycterus rosablanca TaxID=2290929 RepID=UPI002F35EB64
MASNLQWEASAYSLHPIPYPYTFPNYFTKMMAPQYQGYNYYTPYGQYCSPDNQHVQQYQYALARAPEGVHHGASSGHRSAYGYYTQYQPSVASYITYPVQQHQAPLAQWQATAPLPKILHKQITIRDPNQGGRDITQEILSGLNPDTKSVQDLQSEPVSSTPLVAKEEICTDFEEVEQKDLEMHPSKDLGSVTDSTPNEVPTESASVSNVESVISLTVSPFTAPETPALSSPSGSVESGEDVEQNTVPAELICSGLQEEKSKDAENSVSNSTCKEVPKEIESFATGKEDKEDKPTLVPSDTTLSDGEELKIRRVKTMIDFTVERATTEPNTAVMYANFCYGLKNDVSTMKKMLLSRCQEEFKKERKHDMALAKKQKELNDAKKEHIWQKLKKDLEEEKIRSFQCSLLNMEFIAELFKREMLPKSFINSWIEQKLVVNPSEENLECLCKLLTIAGKDLHDVKDKYLMDLYFSAINKIIQQRKLSPRICSMLQGTVDRRQNNWEPRCNNQQVPSKNRDIKKHDDGSITVTIKNQTVNTSHLSNINKPGNSSWEHWGKRGSNRYEARASTEENGSAYIRRNYRKNEHFQHYDRDQVYFRCWDQRDRRYRGQDMRPL